MHLVPATARRRSGWRGSARPQSLVEIELALDTRKQRFAGLKDAFASLAERWKRQSELEKNKLKIKLANAGFRTDNAPMIYQGIRLLGLAVFLSLRPFRLLAQRTGSRMKAMMYIVILGGIGFYLPQISAVALGEQHGRRRSS